MELQTFPKFDPKKKKKGKKCKTKNIENLKDNDIKEETQEDTNDDYTYEFLLNRVYENIPKDSLLKKKKVFTVAVISRLGTKKTLWVNFKETATSMNRDSTHFSNYLLSELSTTGNFDAESQFILNGRFNQQQLHNIQKEYIEQYVKCRNCGNHSTTLSKNKGNYFVSCHYCLANFCTKLN